MARKSREQLRKEIEDLIYRSTLSENEINQELTKYPQDLVDEVTGDVLSLIIPAGANQTQA